MTRAGPVSRQHPAAGPPTRARGHALGIRPVSGLQKKWRLPRYKNPVAMNSIFVPRSEKAQRLLTVAGAAQLVRSTQRTAVSRFTQPEQPGT